MPNFRRHSMRRRVALLAEGVDRNTVQRAYCSSNSVALLAEGVDRNSFQAKNLRAFLASPSSRRAWIEMCSILSNTATVCSRPPRGGRG